MPYDTISDCFLDRERKMTYNIYINLLRKVGSYMYNIGDRIAYPMHGAGTIEAIEEKTIMGHNKRYYVMLVPFGDMKIMVPCESCEKVGIRGIMSKKEMKEIFDVLSKDSSEMSDNWNRRYRDNMEKLKTGDLCDVAEVVRNLMRADTVKKLSMGEKKMLGTATQILVSEVILVQQWDAQKAVSTIETYVKGGEL